MISKNPTHLTKRLYDLINEFQLKQHIISPIRITPASKTLIDLIMTKSSDNKIGVIHLGISDHSLAYICRKVGILRAEPKVVETRQFKNFNSSAFQNDLEMAFQRYYNINNYTNPNHVWETWKTIFLDVADLHAPLRIRKVKSEYCPWMTNVIKKLAQHKFYLKKKAVKFNSSNYHEAYKRCRNELNNKIKVAKTKFYNTKLQKSKNSKEDWNTINILLNRKCKTTVVNELSVDHGRNIMQGKDIVNRFNKSFTSICPKLVNSVTDNAYGNSFDPLSYINPVNSAFHFRDISSYDLKGELQNMQMGKSTGLDKISTKLLKLAGDTIIESLLKIFNLSLKTGIFPDDWKLAKVTPIHKSEDKTLCENYRPISVISNVAKIFEKLVCKQLNTFLENNSIIAKNQSGFR